MADEKIIIAFDIDGCLIHQIDGIDVPRFEVIGLLLYWHRFINCRIFVWSGSGIDYAERWVEKLGLTDKIERVLSKGSFVPDIVFDDENVELGKINIKI